MVQGMEAWGTGGLFMGLGASLRPLLQFFSFFPRSTPHTGDVDLATDGDCCGSLPAYSRAAVTRLNETKAPPHSPGPDARHPCLLKCSPGSCDLIPIQPLPHMW